MSGRAVAVVIPARDEEERIAACLESVLASARVLCPVPSLIVVVDDGSADRTGAVARACLRGRPSLVIRRDRPNVGRARALGVTRALGALAPSSSDRIWLAFTDADTTVPVDWLRHQMDWAERGADAIAGIVRLPAADRAANAAYQARYDAGIWRDGHRHVHGANLGVSAGAYLAVGGFAECRVGEDNDLWRRLRDAGHRLVSDPRLVVQTSARRKSRVTGGFATVLSDMAAGVSP